MPKLFRRKNSRISGAFAVRGYQRATSGAEAAPVVTNSVRDLHSAVLAKREKSRAAT
jgi:hypothetical protein